MWVEEEYSCPQCRCTFSPKPVLCRNTMLADVVRNWGEPAFKMLVGKQRMSNVTFALGRNIELLGLCEMSDVLLRDAPETSQWKESRQDASAYWSYKTTAEENLFTAHNCGTRTVAQTNNAFVVCASKTDTRGTAWWRWWRRGWYTGNKNCREISELHKVEFKDGKILTCVVFNRNILRKRGKSPNWGVRNERKNSEIL